MGFLDCYFYLKIKKARSQLCSAFGYSTQAYCISLAFYDYVLCAEKPNTAFLTEARLAEPQKECWNEKWTDFLFTKLFTVGFHQTVPITHLLIIRVTPVAKKLLLKSILVQTFFNIILLGHSRNSGSLKQFSLS